LPALPTQSEADRELQGGIISTASLAPPPVSHPIGPDVPLIAPLWSCRHAGEIETTAPLKRGPARASSHPTPDLSLISFSKRHRHQRQRLNEELRRQQPNNQHQSAARDCVAPYRALLTLKSNIHSHSNRHDVPSRIEPCSAQPLRNFSVNRRLLSSASRDTKPVATAPCRGLQCDVSLPLPTPRLIQSDVEASLWTQSRDTTRLACNNSALTYTIKYSPMEPRHLLPLWLSFRRTTCGDTIC